MTDQPDTRTSRRQDVEDTALELINVVMSEDWSSDAAGRRVWLRAGGDRHVLLLLRARVARHLAGRHSPIDERAAATLDAALHFPGLPPDSPDRPDGGDRSVPRQRTR